MEEHLESALKTWVSQASISTIIFGFTLLIIQIPKTQSNKIFNIRKAKTQLAIQHLRVPNTAKRLCKKNTSDSASI